MKLMSGNWHVAYRRKPQGSILSDRETPFKVIDNSLFFHAMDSFVFEHKGETYIFAEVYDRLRHRGTIGYSKWEGDGFSSWKQVIIEPYHLSYPFIFENEGDIFIIPESYQNGDVHVYRATDFPNKWEYVEVLVNNVKYVDTTLFECNGKKYAFTYDIGHEKKTLLLFEMKDGKMDLSSCKAISSNDGVARPGGRLFYMDGRIVRVSQDCEEDYGKAVVFSHVSDSFPDEYSEAPIAHVGHGDIILDKKIPYSGIHTYNATSQFEVIDLKGLSFNLLDLVGRLISKLLK